MSGSELRFACPNGHRRSRSCKLSENCPTCRTQAALGEAVATLLRLIPTLSTQVAVAAVSTVAASTGERRRLVNWLREQSRDLGSIGSDCPPVAVRLLNELAMKGLSVALPRCVDCGRHRLLPSVVEGGRVCLQCYMLRRAEPCARCGRTKLVYSRQSDGLAVCQRCRTRDPITWRPCGRCGRQAQVVTVESGLTVGRCCYVYPLLRCSVCGLNKALTPHKTRRPVCGECADKPTAVCSSCGLDAPVVPGQDEHPLCSRCRSLKPAPCQSCSTLTVGRDLAGRPRCPACYRRPVGTCGRCGRVRAIVRLARGGDPDLCGVCWQGPVMTCETCGRVRPCRGERKGRMLCIVCRPVTPQTCAHCGEARQPMAHWHEGPVCKRCYARALASKANCPRCGRLRRLRQYPGVDQPVCAECAGQPATHVCTVCGAEDLLYERGVCSRCVLHRRLRVLFGDDANCRRTGLAPLFDALTAARDPRATLDWLNKDDQSSALLGRIARGELRLTYDVLDQLEPMLHTGRSAPLEYLLVAAGALPARDPVLGALERWCERFVARIDQPEHAQLLRTYVHWHVVRRLRARPSRTGLTESTGSSTRTRLKCIGSFLDWLSQRGGCLSECHQLDVDTWCASQPPHRINIVRTFATWAMERKAMPALAVQPASSIRPVAAIERDQRWALARRLLDAPDIDAADRVAGALVVVYGQPVTRINRLTVSDLIVQTDRVAIRLGSSPIEIPEPLAGYMRELVAERQPHPRKVQIRSDPGWLFVGANPGRPISQHTLAARLHRHGIRPARHRLAALYQLASEMPAALVADLLGISPGTANLWARLAGHSWNAYPALRTEER